ncbi:MAG: leucine-rich repeat domain-containing protein [Christensenellales bacterium]
MFRIKDDILVSYYGDEKEIVVPFGIREIREYAFLDCVQIEEINLPDSVEIVEARAFYGCKNLRTVDVQRAVLPLGFDDKWLEGTKATFTLIEQSAYDGDIPDGIEIENDSIVGYSGTASELTIPDGIGSIGDKAFFGCKTLRKVVISDGVTSIGKRAFAHCDGLETVVMSDSVKKIDDSAFEECRNLKNIVLSKGLKKIGKNAFLYCVSLDKIVIPDKVTTIGVSAFGGCNVKRITIPASVTEIGESAFWNCPLDIRKVEGNNFHFQGGALYDRNGKIIWKK